MIDWTDPRRDITAADSFAPRHSTIAAAPFAADRPGMMHRIIRWLVRRVL